VLLPNGGSAGGDEVAKRIAQTLAAPFFLGASKVGVEASVGIATAASDEQPTLEELLRQVDIAMYKAKTDRSGFAHFAASNDDGTPNLSRARTRFKGTRTPFRVIMQLVGTHR